MRLTKRAFKEWGRQGGLIGGKRRKATLTAAQRSEIARLGGVAKAAKNGKPVDKPT